MIFKVKRLHDATDAGRRYHLFDEAHHLLLVADQGSPWLPEEPTSRVRFARPGGEQIATLDLPRAGGAPPGKKVSYAIIFNHAVYAILNAQAADPNSPRDYLLEVEGNRWFVTQEEPERPASLNIYSQSPADAEIYPETELPGPIGTIRLSEESSGGYDFTISLPEGRLSQAALIALALVVIADGVDSRPSK
jgi:hypothetical protein